MNFFCLATILLTLLTCCNKYEDQIVRGKITDEMTGLPVAGVSVSLYYDSSNKRHRKEWHVIKHAITDSDGNYTITFEKYKDRKMENFSLNLLFPEEYEDYTAASDPAHPSFTESDNVVNFSVYRISYLGFMLTKTNNQPNYVSEYGMYDAVSNTLSPTAKLYGWSTTTEMYSDSIVPGLVGPFKEGQTIQTYIKIQDDLNQETTIYSDPQYIPGGDTVIFSFSF